MSYPAAYAVRLIGNGSSMPSCSPFEYTRYMPISDVNLHLRSYNMQGHEGVYDQDTMVIINPQAFGAGSTPPLHTLHPGALLVRRQRQYHQHGHHL